MWCYKFWKSRNNSEVLFVFFNFCFFFLSGSPTRQLYYTKIISTVGEPHFFTTKTRPQNYSAFLKKTVESQLHFFHSINVWREINQIFKNVTWNKPDLKMWKNVTWNKPDSKMWKKYNSNILLYLSPHYSLIILYLSSHYPLIILSLSPHYSFA